MAMTRTTFTIDEGLIEAARQFDVNVSAAAREGVAEAIRRARVDADRQAYVRLPEQVDDSWNAAEAWGPA